MTKYLNLGKRVRNKEITNFTSKIIKYESQRARKISECEPN